MALSIFFLFFYSNIVLADPIRWAVSTHSPDAFQKYSIDFKNELEKESAGRFKIEISKVPQSEKALLSMMRGNQFDVGIFYSEVVAAFNPILWILDMPFLFRDDLHVKTVLSSPLKEELLEGLKTNDLFGLAFVNFQDVRVLASQHKISLPDLEERPIRTAINPASQFFFKKLGLYSLVTSHLDHRLVLESSLISIAELSMLWVDEKQLQATPFLYTLHNSRAPAVIVFNLKSYNKLSVDEKRIIGQISEKISINAPALKTQKLIQTNKEQIKLESATNQTYDNFKSMFQDSLVLKIKEYPKQP